MGMKKEPRPVRIVEYKETHSICVQYVSRRKRQRYCFAAFDGRFRDVAYVRNWVLSQPEVALVEE